MMDKRRKDPKKKKSTDKKATTKKQDDTGGKTTNSQPTLDQMPIFIGPSGDMCIGHYCYPLKASPYRYWATRDFRMSGAAGELYDMAIPWVVPTSVGGLAVYAAAGPAGNAVRRLAPLARGAIGWVLRGADDVARAPVFLDNDVLVAAEKGSAAVLAEIRAGQSFVTPNQLREFLNVGKIPQAQIKARARLLEAEGIEVFGGEEARAVAGTEAFKNVFNAVVKAGHGRADAALGAFSRATGFQALTLEKRISNFFNLSQPQLGVPIRRLTR